MTTQEMFEALGLELKNHPDSNIVHYGPKPGKMAGYVVQFERFEQRYNVVLFGRGWNWVPIELHKAITQQMIELGWLE